MADIILQIIIPEVSVTKVLNTFKKITGTKLIIISHDDDFEKHWNFIIPPKDVSETDKDFVKRIFKEMGNAILNMVSYAEDELRYKAEIATIVPPTPKVFDNTLM